LLWDGSGLTLTSKRLDQARFVWPRIADAVMRLAPGQLGALFEGLDGKRVPVSGCGGPHTPQNGVGWRGRSARNDPATL